MSGRPSMDVGRPSVGSRSSGRHSNRFNVGNIKDPRPINDRTYQNRQSVFLLGFLVDHHYDKMLTQRDLLHPTAKKFQDIITFLFRKIDPSFHFGKNIVNDVHTMFKGLQYPVQISKTALSAVGSAHTWPQLLASLTWLIDLISYDAEATKEQDHETIETLFFEYLHSAYDAFMANDDEKYALLDEELAATFEARDAELAAECESISKANDELRAELESLRETASSLPGLLEKQKMYRHDAGKLDDAITVLERKRDAAETRLAQDQARLEQRKSELSRAEARVAELQSRLRAQDLSAADVERISKDRARLREALAQADDVKEQRRAATRVAEQQLQDNIDQLEEEVRQYTTRAVQLKLVPASAKNAEGKSYDIVMSDDIRDSTDPVLNIDVKHFVKPAIHIVRDKYKAKLHDLRADALEHQSSIQSAEEEKSERLEEIATLEAKVSRVEELIRREKEAMEIAVAKAEQETEQCEERIHQLRHQPSPNMTALQNQFAQEEASLNELLTSHEHERITLQQRLHAALVTLADHKSAFEGHLAETLQEMHVQKRVVMDKSL